MTRSSESDTAARLRERDRTELVSKVFAPTHKAIYHLGGDLRLAVVLDEDFPAPADAAAVRESGGATYFVERSRLQNVQVIW